MIWVGYGILKIRSWIRIRNKSFATVQSGTGTANTGSPDLPTWVLYHQVSHDFTSSPLSHPVKPPRQ